MGTKFDKHLSAVEENNYLTKIAWPKIPLRNFTLKNCSFRATYIVKNGDKEKYVYSGYRC